MPELYQTRRVDRLFENIKAWRLSQDGTEWEEEVTINLPAETVYQVYNSDTITTDEPDPYILFELGETTYKTMDRDLLTTRHYSTLTVLAVNTEVRLKGKGLKYGRIKVKLGPDVWLVEFNYDIEQRMVLLGSEIEPRQKWTPSHPSSNIYKEK